MIKKYVFGMPLETGAVVFNELEGENGFAHFPDFEESGADGQADPAGGGGTGTEFSGSCSDFPGSGDKGDPGIGRRGAV